MLYFKLATVSLHMEAVMNLCQDYGDRKCVKNLCIKVHYYSDNTAQSGQSGTRKKTGFWNSSGISWTICKQSAPCSRQTTTPTPHHSILLAGCSSWCQTNSVKALKAHNSSIIIDKKLAEKCEIIIWLLLYSHSIK